MDPNALYYQDSHLAKFQARVLRCHETDKGWEVTLDQTAFYPEGGGQAGDRGTLGQAQVLDTREQDDQVLHLCDRPLEVGTQVEGVLDWNRRFDLMQQHSGEHILSGLIHRRYGFHNVGFHMGADIVTIDFDGVIPPEDLPALELAANEAIWKNPEIRVLYPEPLELARLPYRSKRALEGTVRLVEIPGYDLCACCGTHVKRTGEIGMVKLLSMVKFRQGVRMELVCGLRALRYFSAVTHQNRLVSNVFSAKPLETGEAAQKFQADFDALKYRAVGLENRLFDLTARSHAGKGDVVLFEEGLSSEGLQRLTDKVGSLCGGRCIVLSGSDGEGYRYAICDQGGDLRAFVKEWNTALRGRGGGKPHFVQGSVQADRAAIEEFLGL